MLFLRKKVLHCILRHASNVLTVELSLRHVCFNEICFWRVYSSSTLIKAFANWRNIHRVIFIFLLGFRVIILFLLLWRQVIYLRLLIKLNLRSPKIPLSICFCFLPAHQILILFFKNWFLGCLELLSTSDWILRHYSISRIKVEIISEHYKVIRLRNECF